MAATEYWNRRRQSGIPVWLPLIAAALIIARIVSYQMRPAPAGTDLVKWVPLAYAQERAKAEGKLVLYDFTAEWCGPCHILDAEVFQDAEIAERINQRFIPVRVVDRMQEDGANVPAVATMQRQYGVNAFPTVIVTSAQGSLRTKMVGYEGRQEFVRMIDQVR